jgi:hypothetical protein
VKSTFLFFHRENNGLLSATGSSLIPRSTLNRGTLFASAPHFHSEKRSQEAMPLHQAKPFSLPSAYVPLVRANQKSLALFFTVKPILVLQLMASR